MKMYEMLFWERKRLDIVVASRGMEIERKSKRIRERKKPLCLGEEDGKHILLSC